MVDTEIGELKEQRLAHREGTKEFYPVLATRGQQVRVDMEASGHARWFERLLADLKLELWMGDAAEMRRKCGGKQKTHRQDAQHIRIGICGNCCGIGTAWCKRAPGS